MAANTNQSDVLMLQWTRWRTTEQTNAPEFENLTRSDVSPSVSQSDLDGLFTLDRRDHVTVDETQKLAEISDTRRIVVINRGPNGISYSTILDVLLALLVECGFLAGFYLLSVWVFHGQAGGGGGNLQGVSFEATGGIVTDQISAAAPAAALAKQNLPPTPHLPNQPLWQPTISATSLLDPKNPDNSQLPIIGPESNQNPWQAPTPRNAGNALPSRDADPDADGFGSQPYSFAKGAESGGIGSSGDDNSRGPSDADISMPNMIAGADPPTSFLPLKYQYISFSVGVEFIVLANGHVDPTSIQVVESSGYPEVDQVYINYIKKAIFRPAIKNGQPIAQPYSMGWSQ
jgi:TonB family protein